MKPVRPLVDATTVGAMIAAGVTSAQVAPTRISSICKLPVPVIAVPAWRIKSAPIADNVAVPRLFVTVGVGSTAPGVGFTKSEAAIGDVDLSSLTVTKTDVPIG